MSKNKWLIGCLLAVNGALGASLAMRFLPEHRAQARIGGRGAADYIAASGYNGQGGIVYVMDTKSGMLSGVMTLQAGQGQRIFLAPRNVFGDIRRYQARNGGGRVGRRRP